MTDSATPAHHDVLVLGGGVAGCVVAARLSADADRAVCLVEAGPDYGPDHQDWPGPMLDARVLPRDEVWEPDSEPYRIRAKLVGGSSCVNGCWHTWGTASDHAGWAARGGPDWSAEGLEPHRRAAVEMMRLRAIPDSELSVWSSGALSAAAELGYPEIADMAAPGVGPGYGCPPVNAVGDLRWNVAFAYLDPVRARPNLSVLSGTTVHRLIVDGGVVRGVEVVQDGTPRTLTADTYVLSSGTYGSPAVLLRSGIGPAGPGQTRSSITGKSRASASASEPRTRIPSRPSSGGSSSTPGRPIAASMSRNPRTSSRT